MSWDTFAPAVASLGQSALGQWLGQSTARIAWLLTFHLIGLTLLLGSTVVASLHLLGLFLRNVPTPQLKRNVVPIMLIGLFFSLTSGTLTFIGGAQEYYAGEWFRTKMLFLGAALLFQATIFQWILGRQHTARLARVLTGLTALVLWFGVAFSGRAIGFF